MPRWSHGELVQLGRLKTWREADYSRCCTLYTTRGAVHFILLQALYTLYYSRYCTLYTTQGAVLYSVLYTTTVQYTQYYSRACPLHHSSVHNHLPPPCRVSVGSAVLMRGEGGVWGRAMVQEELLGEYLVKSCTVTGFPSSASLRLGPG